MIHNIEMCCFEFDWQVVEKKSVDMNGNIEPCQCIRIHKMQHEIGEKLIEIANITDIATKWLKPSSIEQNQYITCCDSAMIWNRCFWINIFLTFNDFVSVQVELCFFYLMAISIDFQNSDVYIHFIEIIWSFLQSILRLNLKF